MAETFEIKTEQQTEDPGQPPEGATETEQGVKIDMNAKPAEQQEQDTERPAWLPEKFASPEDMAKAYGELETKLGQGEQQTEQKSELEIDTSQPAEEAIAKANLDPAALQQELIANNGTLTDETFAAFEKAGIPRETVESFIEGQRALSERATARVFEMAGGQEQFAAMTEWAKTGLTSDQIQAFNSAMKSGNQGQVELATRGLVAAYEAANGRSASLVRDGDPPQSGVKPFLSTEQMVQAMSDSRYHTDPAYVKMVEDRVAVSNF